MASAPNQMMDATWAPCISSLPFSRPHTLSSLPSPLSPALYVSVWKKGRTLSPNYLIIVWLYHLSSLLGTDTIFTLTSYRARFFFYPFLLPSFSRTLSLPSPVVVSAGTLFSTIPLSFLYTTTAKQTPGTF